MEWHEYRNISVAQLLKGVDNQQLNVKAVYGEMRNTYGVEAGFFGVQIIASVPGARCCAVFQNVDDCTDHYGAFIFGSVRLRRCRDVFLF